MSGIDDLDQLALERGEYRPQIVTTLEDKANFTDQGEHPLLAAQGRRLDDLDFRTFGGPAEGGEYRLLATEFDRIIPPQAGRDHPAIDAEDQI